MAIVSTAALATAARVLAGLSLAVSLIGVTTAAEASEHADQCTTVRFFGVNGSGDKPADNRPQSMSLPLRKTYSDFHTIMSEKGISTSAEAIEYPAVAVWDLRMLPWSVPSGMLALRGRIAEQAVACPHQEFVLAGYSQGAWVIQWALPFLAGTYSGRISAVLLYGDPLFHNADKFAVPKNASDSRKHQGLLARIYDLKRTKLPSWLPAGRTYCREGDVICSRGTGKLAACVKELTSLKSIREECPYFRHTNYQTSAPGAANWLAGLFDDNSGVPFGEQISVKPAKGAPGSVVTVRGKGWEEHHRLGWQVPIGLDPSSQTLVKATPDERGRFTVSLKIPASAHPGPTTVWALIGNGGSARAPFTVTAAPEPHPAGKPDLVVTSVYDLHRDPICAGMSPTFRADIVNHGGKASGFFNIRWVVDGQATFDGGHYSIAPGATDTHDHIWREITAGEHTLQFIADFDHAIAESSEGNNTFTLRITAGACGGAR